MKNFLTLLFLLPLLAWGQANTGGSTSAGSITGSGSGSGTVTSVGFTGGIISVATGTTTPAMTVAGTSGGIPYFSDGTHWATSAALANQALVVGGGAGAAPATITTGTGVVTALGVNTGTAGAFQLNNASGAALTALTAANISTGALANGMTATQQTTGDATDKLATDNYVNNNNYSKQSVLTYNSTTMAIDFAGDPVKTVAVSGGNITFTTTNLAAGKTIIVIITNDGSSRNYTLPAWIPIGAALPTTLAASKVAVVSLYSTGTTDGAVLCNYGVQP